MTLIKRFVKMLIAFFYKLKNLNKCKISATTDIIIRGCGFEGKTLWETTVVCRTRFWVMLLI